jgi:hypothetical protein
MVSHSLPNSPQEQHQNKRNNPSKKKQKTKNNNHNIVGCEVHMSPRYIHLLRHWRFLVPRLDRTCGTKSDGIISRSTSESACSIIISITISTWTCTLKELRVRTWLASCMYLEKRKRHYNNIVDLQTLHTRFYTLHRCRCSSLSTRLDTPRSNPLCNLSTCSSRPRLVHVVRSSLGGCNRQRD